MQIYTRWVVLTKETPYAYRRAPCCLSVVLAAPVSAQSQAANGSIEGTVTDTSGGVLPGVTVTITNTDTGNERSVVTNDRRASIARCSCRSASIASSRSCRGSSRSEQTGISLQAGQHRRHQRHAVGRRRQRDDHDYQRGADRAARKDRSRPHDQRDRDLHNLPLPSRNPYNFAFLQANVTGYENNEFGVPRINANGSQMHTNYQLDGNTNTEKDRAGLRLLPISEVLVREVKVVTNGFAPEFGQTTGMVYNAITQSGTNTVHGSASYRFKRNPMSLAHVLPRADGA